MVKVYINLPIVDGAYGGSYRFLGALREYFIAMGVYEQNPENADVILFSASQYIPETCELKKTYPEKVFIHRIDGPIRLYHKMSDKRDLLINFANKYVADGTVFQSAWSKKRNKEMGLLGTDFETTIMNAPDEKKFFPKKETIHTPIRLLASSWSSFRKKGFDVYQYLDENIDPEKYHFTFVGNSSIEFKNSTYRPPLDPDELAVELRNFDIFITASQNDPCSNSLIEALHSGLPSIVLNSGGHPEIVREGGVVFNKKEEVFDAIDSVFKNYQQFVESIDMPSMKEVSAEYYDFCKKVHQEITIKGRKTKKITTLQALHIKVIMKIWLISRNWDKLIRIYEKISNK